MPPVNPTQRMAEPRQQTPQPQWQGMGAGPQGGQPSQHPSWGQPGAPLMTPPIKPDRRNTSKVMLGLGAAFGGLLFGLILGAGIGAGANGPQAATLAVPSTRTSTVTVTRTVASTTTATAVSTTTATVTATATETTTASSTTTVTVSAAATSQRTTSSTSSSTIKRLVSVPPKSTAPATKAPAKTAYYSNCTAARQAGAAPLYRGDPGYRAGLDRDNDGVACE